MTKGFIVFRMIKEDEEVITLGGAGWDSKEQTQKEWDELPKQEEYSIFVADLEDQEGTIFDTKEVSQSTIENRLGSPIETLIEKGKKELEKELAQD